MGLPPKPVRGATLLLLLLLQSAVVSTDNNLNTVLTDVSLTSYMVEMVIESTESRYGEGNQKYTIEFQQHPRYDSDYYDYKRDKFELSLSWSQLTSDSGTHIRYLGVMRDSYLDGVTLCNATGVVNSTTMPNIDSSGLWKLLGHKAVDFIEILYNNEPFILLDLNRIEETCPDMSVANLLIDEKTMNGVRKLMLDFTRLYGTYNLGKSYHHWSGVESLIFHYTLFYPWPLARI